MKEIFEETDVQGALLVGASNVFNVFAMEDTQWKCRIMWPSASRFLFNTYHGYALILICGTDKIILSKKGTAQGNPLGMSWYRIGVIPLTNELKCEKIFQNWYLDDSIGLKMLLALRDWFVNMMKIEPTYGYFL